MYKYNKNISTIFTILFFSISGIPPFIGFISKLFWVKTLISEYNIFIFLLLLTFLLVSFYYVRLIKNIYTNFNKQDNSLFYISKLNYESSIIIVINQLLLLFFIFNSAYIINLVKIILLDFFFYIKKMYFNIIKSLKYRKYFFFKI